jgi:hypothetical protein
LSSGIARAAYRFLEVLSFLLFTTNFTDARVRVFVALANVTLPNKTFVEWHCLVINTAHHRFLEVLCFFLFTTDFKGSRIRVFVGLAQYHPTKTLVKWLCTCLRARGGVIAIL